MKFELEHKPLATFSFSSLTDIVLLLLIFFLLTSQFVISNGINVNLPKTKNATSVSASRLIVNIDSEGNIFFKGKKISTTKLNEEFRELDKKTFNNLIIRADNNVKLEIVVKVIDIARGNGIEKFTVQTEKVN